MFGGKETEQPVQQYSEPQQQQHQQEIQHQGQSCQENARAFTQCLDATNNDMSSCSYYLDALRECQRIAAQY
jgi:hypothetical protein